MTHSSHFGERPDGRRISPHAKTELMNGHMSTYFSSLCSQTLIEDQRENEIRGKKSTQVGKGLVRASLLLGFVETISHWKANLGRMKRCRASGAALGCQLGHGQGKRHASPCTGVRVQTLRLSCFPTQSSLPWAATFSMVTSTGRLRSQR